MTGIGQDDRAERDGTGRDRDVRDHQNHFGQDKISRTETNGTGKDWEQVRMGETGTRFGRDRRDRDGIGARTGPGQRRMGLGLTDGMKGQRPGRTRGRGPGRPWPCSGATDVTVPELRPGPDGTDVAMTRSGMDRKESKR